VGGTGKEIKGQMDTGQTKVLEGHNRFRRPNDRGSL